MLKKFLSLALLLLGLVQQSVVAQPSGSLVSKDPTLGAQKVYKFLLDNYGKKTLSGVMTGELNPKVNILEQPDVKAILQYDGGKVPMVIGFDLMHATGKMASSAEQKDYTNATVALAKQVWIMGGIPAFCYHWKDPSLTFDSYKPQDVFKNFDYRKAFKNKSHKWNVKSEEYKALVRDIDSVSSVLLRLQDEGVAVLWRPLHEASGGWFWWGGKNLVSADDYIALYRLVFDRMVGHNGLHNLIWVWDIERSPRLGYDHNALDKSWYPGDEYVDIIGVDYYSQANDHSSLVQFRNKIVSLMGNKKMIALSENGPIPDAAQMRADNCRWSWWMPWYDSWNAGFISQTSPEVWERNMLDEDVVTVCESPGWIDD